MVSKTSTCIQIAILLMQALYTRFHHGFGATCEKNMMSFVVSLCHLCPLKVCADKFAGGSPIKSASLAFGAAVALGVYLTRDVSGAHRTLHLRLTKCMETRCTTRKHMPIQCVNYLYQCYR